MASGTCQVSGEFCESIDCHHVIPREYGGENGPTVLLSPTVHQTIHRLAMQPSLLEVAASRYSIRGRALMIRLGESIRFCKENFNALPSNKITITLSDKELDVLTEQAKSLNITSSQLASRLLKKILNL